MSGLGAHEVTRLWSWRIGSALAALGLLILGFAIIVRLTDDSGGEDPLGLVMLVLVAPLMALQFFIVLPLFLSSLGREGSVASARSIAVAMSPFAALMLVFLLIALL
jgi:uncharacterized membrane protein YpjA